MDSHTLLHTKWIHDSAAASAKRTEIRRPQRGSRRVKPRLNILADICNSLMKSEFRPPAALAGPPAFHSLSTQLFATIRCILRYFVPRSCSEFEFWTHSGPDPRNIMQIMFSGSSELKIWTPPDPNPRYIMRIMLSGSSEFEFWTPPGPSFFVFFFPTIDQFD